MWRLGLLATATATATASDGVCTTMGATAAILPYIATASACINAQRCPQSGSDLGRTTGTFAINSPAYYADWLTPANQYYQHVDFEFSGGGARTVERFEIYNQNENNAREVKTAELLRSIDGGVTYEWVLDAELAKSDKASPNPANVVPIPASKSLGTHWRLKIKEVWGVVDGNADGYAGLTVVHLFGCGAPPPSLPPLPSPPPYLDAGSLCLVDGNTPETACMVGLYCQCPPTRRRMSKRRKWRRWHSHVRRLDDDGARADLNDVIVQGDSLIGEQTDATADFAEDGGGGDRGGDGDDETESDDGTHYGDRDGGNRTRRSSDWAIRDRHGVAGREGRRVEGRRLFGAKAEAACSCQPTPAPPPPIVPPPSAPQICPDFAFDGSHLTADKCPHGWTCSEPYASSGGGCGSHNGVFVGSQSITTASCNDCMTPSVSHDGYFFKIAWDNQCGYATSAPFTLPAGTVAVRFLVGGGADLGGMWVYRTSDDGELCTYTLPPQCPMEYKKCSFGADLGGTRVHIRLEKPCSGSGGWENLVFDDIHFVDASDNNLNAALSCLWPPTAT